MSVAKKLLLITMGYAPSVVGGATVVAMHELLIPADVAQNPGAFLRWVNFYKTRSEHNEPAIPPKLSVKADVADRQKRQFTAR